MATQNNKRSTNQKAARWAYGLFFSGAALAGIGFYGVGGNAGMLMVLAGSALILLSIIPAIIAFPWILNFG
jgi:NADH:ubiquinone oxidoreductase subunit K